MRYVAVALMFAAAVAAALIQPPEQAEPDPAPGMELPPVSICPLIQAGERQTSVSVLSSVDGPGRLSAFSSGTETGAVAFRTGPTGAVTIPASEAGAVSNAGGLIEMPSATTASGVLVAGPGSRAAESCADIPAGRVFISGGSTASGAFFEIQLINPYAGEAIVDLTVATDTGIESNDRFNAVVVPPLSAITLDMTEIIPGREQISVEIETSRGSILAYGRQTIDGEIALWRAVPPQLDWWLPVPEGGATKQVLIAGPESVEVEYQVDLYGPDGLVEAHATGIVEPLGRAVIPLADISEEAIGVRVITTGPVVPALQIDSAAGMSWTTASPVEANVWLLPGASAPPGGSGTVVIFNTGLEPATVTVRSLGESNLIRTLEVAAEDVLEMSLIAADGYRIESSGPVVVMWTSGFQGAGTAAIGIPLQDG